MSITKPILTNSPQEDSLESSVRRSSGPIIGLAVLILLSIFGLMIPLPHGGRILPKLGDMVHGPLFAGIMISVVIAWNYMRPPITVIQSVTRLITAAFLVFSFGVITEVAQGLTGRSTSLHDLVADSCGIVAGCCLLIAGNSGRFLSSWRKSITLFLVATVSIAISWIGAIASINDVIAMNREFPLLASFERRAELERWHFANCHARRVRRDATTGKDTATDGDWMLEVSYQPGGNSSATMYEMKNDWSLGNVLVVDAFALKDPTLLRDTVEVAVQIIDADHGVRFQDICRKVFVLELGKTTRLRFPKEEWITNKGRPLNVKRILYFDLQFASVPATATVRYDAIRLLSDKDSNTNNLASELSNDLAAELQVE